MNQVILIGRLTRDPEVRYTGDQMAIATFTLAIDRPVRQDREKQADFLRVTVFGRQAEVCEKYLSKGRMAAVQGRLQTGSYKNREGVTVYTTDVVADRVEFIDWGDKQGRQQGGSGGGFGRGPEGGFDHAPGRAQGGPGYMPGGGAGGGFEQNDAPPGIPEGFTALDDGDDDIPF
ncbi:MAG: single-stranded DNA-binding protein [Clostridiales Family XIII bacterium]|jgi:single-strand DNA-binding protein|nr:single-stranded DNA-binding protein [Clostridiales Family XIII bacterium]